VGRPAADGSQPPNLDGQGAGTLTANDCVHLTEALSRQVYDPAVHLQPGEDEPPAARTKQPLTR